MPITHRQNTRIYYETFGTNGPWLTLVNGHGRSSRDFRLMAEKLAKVGIRCLTFDNRGSGQTETENSFTLIDIAEDVQFLWEELDISQTALLGLSMGGLISQLLSQLNPNKILGLILVGTSCSEELLSPYAFLNWGHSTESVESKLRHYFSQDFQKRNKLLISAMVKQILASIEGEKFEYKATLQRNAMRGINLEDQLSKIICPCLIMHGTADEIIPISAAEKMHQLIKNSQLLKLDGIGHLVLAEYSKGLTDEIVNFFRENSWI